MVGLLWKPLQFCIRSCPMLISICMRLHNFCVDEEGVQSINQCSSFFDCETEDEAFRVWWSISEASRSFDDHNRGSRRDMYFCNLRELLTLSLKSRAITRPALCWFAHLWSSAHRCCAFLSAASVKAIEFFVRSLWSDMLLSWFSCFLSAFISETSVEVDSSILFWRDWSAGAENRFFRMSTSSEVMRLRALLWWSISPMTPFR